MTLEGLRRGDPISPLLRSCLGPRGRPKLLSSILSSSSQRLLPLLRSSSPFARVVVKGARAHLSSFGDGGLLCTVLALRLASNHPPMTLPLVGSLYEHFATEFLTILETQVSFDVDFGELLPLRGVVRTLLSSKPACSLSGADCEAVCSLVLRAFLEAAPRGVGVEGGVGLAPTHSKVVQGVAVSLAEGDEERMRAVLSGGPFRACLFVRSLAGEVEWPEEVLASEEGAVESASLRQLSSAVDEAVEAGVRVVLCQKVVHPRLKKRLHNAKVVVLDRLGGESATRIRSILGEGVSGDVWYGTLSRPRVERVGRSRFLVLSSPDATQPRSLLLTHHNQEALAELQVVCRQSLSALFRLLVRPRVCFGGGCSEITSALLLANKVRGRLDSVCSETSSTPGHVLSSLESFVRAVAHLCSSIHQGAVADFATDRDSGHLWQQCPPTNKCACGSRDGSSVTSWRRLTDLAGDILPGSTPSSPSCSSSVVDSLTKSVPQKASCDVPQTLLEQNTHRAINPSTSDSLRTFQDILLDEFDCKRNSLSAAFETSCMLLKTTECIHTSPLATLGEAKVDDHVFSW